MNNISQNFDECLLLQSVRLTVPTGIIHWSTPPCALGYAVANRLASLQEYGSEDDSDWYRDDERNEQEEWKLVVKDDPQSLAYYTLQHELGLLFHGHESRGEYIGTSGPEDFAPYREPWPPRRILAFAR